MKIENYYSNLHTFVFNEQKHQKNAKTAINFVVFYIESKFSQQIKVSSVA